jgi:hypothetical protein
MSCPHCGAAVHPTSRFCTSCGQAVVSAPAPQPLAERPTPPSLPAYGSPGGAATWQLVVMQGADSGQLFALREQAQLGRSSDNDIRLNDDQVSRHHALIQRQAAAYVVSDLGSRNGTYLNGVRLSQPAYLHDGDAIQLGNTMLQARVQQQAPARPPATTPPAYTVPAPAPPPAAPPPAYAAPAAYAGPPAAPQGETVTGVIPNIVRRKGLFGTEAFSLILTPQRLIFAHLTSDMVRAASEQAKKDAKAEGKGFFGQWGAVLGVNSSIAEGYYHMSVGDILREHPDNFSIPNQQVRKVEVKKGHWDEDGQDPDTLTIHAGDKYKFNLQGMSASDAKKLLKQVLGGVVK